MIGSHCGIFEKTKKNKENKSYPSLWLSYWVYIISVFFSMICTVTYVFTYFVHITFQLLSHFFSSSLELLLLIKNL